jgi:nicotinamidase-related amidase
MKQFSVILFLFLAINFSMADEKNQEQKQIKPALVVIDIQNAFMHYIPEDEAKLGLEYINAAIWIFRENGLPIVRVYHTDPNWGPHPDSAAFQFPETIMINEDDPKIVKNFPSAFKKTELDKLLKELDCNTLYLCGLSSVGCVLATYFGAMEREYNVVMIKDAIMSHNTRYTDVVEEAFETVSYQTLKFWMESLPKN